MNTDIEQLQKRIKANQEEILRLEEQIKNLKATPTLLRNKDAANAIEPAAEEYRRTLVEAGMKYLSDEFGQISRLPSTNGRAIYLGGSFDWGLYKDGGETVLVRYHPGTHNFVD